MRTSKKGSNSGTLWPGLTTMSCTSTHHSDNVKQVSFTLLENCGTSLRHKRPLWTNHHPTVCCLLTPVYNFLSWGYNSLNWHNNKPYFPPTKSFLPPPSFCPLIDTATLLFTGSDFWTFSKYHFTTNRNIHNYQRNSPNYKSAKQYLLENYVGTALHMSAKCH